MQNIIFFNTKLQFFKKIIHRKQQNSCKREERQKITLFRFFNKSHPTDTILLKKQWKRGCAHGKIKLGLIGGF